MLPLRTHNGPDRDAVPDKVGRVLLEIGGAIPDMEPRNGRVHRRPNSSCNLGFLPT